MSASGGGGAAFRFTAVPASTSGAFGGPFGAAASSTGAAFGAAFGAAATGVAFGAAPAFRFGAGGRPAGLGAVPAGDSWGLVGLPPPMSGAGPLSTMLIDHLERLSALKASGALSDEEFALAKKKLLEEAAPPAGGPPPPPGAPPESAEAAAPQVGPTPTEPTPYQTSLLLDAAGLFRGCIPQVFEVGAAVDGKYPNRNYYPATVAEVHSGGAEYTLDWKDGDAKHKRQPSANVRRGVTEEEHRRARERAEAEQKKKEAAAAKVRADAETEMRVLLEGADSSVEAVAKAIASAPPNLDEALLTKCHAKLEELNQTEELKKELARLVGKSDSTSSQLASSVSKAEGKQIPAELLDRAIALIAIKKEQEEVRALKEKAERIAAMTLGELVRSAELTYVQTQSPPHLDLPDVSERLLVITDRSGSLRSSRQSPSGRAWMTRGAHRCTRCARTPSRRRRCSLRWPGPSRRASRCRTRLATRLWST